jgi:hypothetical protein
MVKRDKRNIGKRVKHINPKSLFFGRVGTVKGFRGDIRKGVPVVSVFFDSVGFIEPIPGSNLEIVEETMPNSKQFTFSERMQLNDQMTALPEGPYVRFVTEAPSRPPEVERFVRRHKDEFIAKHGKKKGTSLAFAIGHTQFKKGNLEQNEIVLPNNLAECETQLLNRFDDQTLSNLAFQEWSQELLDYIEEAAPTTGILSITKGDWVQLQNGELIKVQNVVNGIVQAKRAGGELKKIRITRLSRIGKHQGKPAFGFLSPRQD